MLETLQRARTMGEVVPACQAESRAPGEMDNRKMSARQHGSSCGSAPGLISRERLSRGGAHLRRGTTRTATGGGAAEAGTNAAEGLERREPGAYDVLLTDFGMPGMNGVELVERARERDAGLRVIMLTASGADLDPAARRLGFTLLRKPLDLGRLKLALVDA